MIFLSSTTGLTPIGNMASCCTWIPLSLVFFFRHNDRSKHTKHQPRSSVHHTASQVRQLAPHVFHPQNLFQSHSRPTGPRKFPKLFTTACNFKRPSGADRRTWNRIITLFCNIPSSSDRLCLVLYWCDLFSRRCLDTLHGSDRKKKSALDASQLTAHPRIRILHFFRRALRSIFGRGNLDGRNLALNREEFFAVANSRRKKC